MKKFDIILSLLLLGLAASCTTEPQMEGAVAEPRRGMASVNFNVRAPGMSRGASMRDFPVGFEENIADITLFLAHDNGAGFIMDSMIIVDQFREVSATTQAFTVELPVSAVPTKIFAVGNLRNSLAGVWGTSYTTNTDFIPYGKGLDENEFVRFLCDDWSTVSTDITGVGNTAMYMAGSAELPTISKGDINLHIPLLRWVARADVNIDLGADSRPFVPTEVTLWHGYGEASLLPDASAYDPDNAARVLTPTLVSVARLDNDLSIPVTTIGTTGTIATTYVGEHDAQTDYNGKLEAPCLILGGYFDGSPDKSYYRIDFDPQVAGHPFGQVLRNWHYIFNVTKIMSAGYATPQEAADNPAPSIVLDVEMWDESVQQINFTGTGGYMYVNTLEVLLNYNQSAQNTFVVRSTLDFDWGFDPDEAVQSVADTTIVDANFSVRITGRQVNADYTDYTFTVSTLADNITNVRNEAGIFISADGGLISLKLTQRAESVADRTINVLSLTDGIGSQGIYFANGKNNTGITLLRTILTNPTWFGPTGVVKCGGFTFDRFQTGEMETSSIVSLDELQRALDATDILITCYASNPSQAVVDKILNWSQKPYHVLFVASDGGGTPRPYGDDTNVLLRQNLHDSPVFNNGLTWYTIGDLAPLGGNTTSNNANLNSALGTDYLLQLGAAGGFVPKSGNPDEPVNVAPNAMIVADQTPENIAFTGGPFGQPESVPSTAASYIIWDGIAEWAMPSASSPVMPLLVLRANIFGYNSASPVVAKTNAMMIGVDVEHTVVYMGEGQQMVDYLFAPPPAGATVGLASSPYYSSLTVLVSNIWAWAVKNVLAQVKED